MTTHYILQDPDWWYVKYSTTLPEGLQKRVDKERFAQTMDNFNALLFSLGPSREVQIVVLPILLCLTLVGFFMVIASLSSVPRIVGYVLLFTGALANAIFTIVYQHKVSSY